MSTRAFDLALFVATPVNVGDGVVVNALGPPFTTMFKPLIADAPTDGNTYGRNNAAWVAVSGGGAGIVDAPSDGTLYARKSVTWTHITHADVTDWTATLAPYALTSAIPAASSTTPVMDGAAAIGVATTWAKADHVHPSDTSRLATTGGTLTGALTPSQTAGLVGTTAANNANAGAVGEYLQVDQTTNVALTSNTGKNVASISLTAGDWDVEGNIYIIFSASGTNTIGGISTTSAGFSAVSLGTYSLTAPSQTVASFATGAVRVSVAATTTVYLVALAVFGSGTGNAQGSIRARRMR